MPWHPLPRIAFAIATYPFQATSPSDLPLELGDELYIIEETSDGGWLRGYLVAPPSLLAGLTSVKGQTLEARVFSGIFPRSCVEVREMLGEVDEADADYDDGDNESHNQADSAKSGINGAAEKRKSRDRDALDKRRSPLKDITNGTTSRLSMALKRDPGAPRPAAPVPMLKIGDETPTSAGEPLIDEIASCLREWHSTNLHELLLSRQYPRLDQLSHLITSLNMSRQQLLHNVLTAHESERVREKSVWDLVRVNKLCGGEIIVRDPKARGRVMTGDDSVVEITKLQSVMSLLDEPPRPPVELTALHHLLVDVKGFVGPSTDETSLLLYLVSKPRDGPPTTVSEPFLICIPPGGTIGSLAQHPQTRALFSDLSAQDVGDVISTEAELYLVAKLRVAQQIPSTGKPLSRQNTGVTTPQKDGASSSSQAPNASPKAGSRRSMMWGSKSRVVFSRGSAGLPKLDEQADGDDDQHHHQRPPSTAASRTDQSIDGHSISYGPPALAVQRTTGVGVLHLNPIMKQQDEEVEQVLTIWTSSAKFSGSDKAEAGEGWDTVIRHLLDSRTGHYEKSRGGERLQLHLRSFRHDDAETLIYETPTLLSGVCRTNKVGFSGAPTKQRSDIYFTIDHATLTKGSLLSRFGSSPTAISSSVQGNSLQMTVEVRRQSGERIESCIYASSNVGGVSTLRTVATERGMGWKETMRLVLTPEDVQVAHVVLTLADAPHGPFAVAYMPLWHENTFMSDGRHGLVLHKYDEHTASAVVQGGKGGNSSGGNGGYLSLPWDAPSDRSGDSGAPIASVQVETYLCSTRFSQNRIVLGLLRWREASRDDVPDMLKQFVFVPEIEIVKMLREVLDKLFEVLLEFSGSDVHEDLVFMALVRVLDIVHDRRFNMAPLVEQYAETQFDSPFTTQCLVRSLTRLLERPTEPQTARKLRSTFKVVRLILKFIVHGRGQEVAKESGVGIKSTSVGFSRNIKNIFKALDTMMRNQAPVLVGSQTLAVQHFHTWLPELASQLSPEEILHIAIDFVDACNQVKGKLVLYKLVLIINYTKLDVFAHPEQRTALSTNIVRWIAPHWGHVEKVTDLWREQVRLCCAVVASQVDQLGPSTPDCIPKIVDSYLCMLADPPSEPRNRFSLLFPTSYPFPHRNISADTTIEWDEGLVELSAVLSAVSSSPGGMQLDFAEEQLSVLLENVLRVHMSILMGEAFPDKWLSVHIHHHRSAMGTLQYLANVMLESFLPDPDDAESFGTELWKMFFTTLLKLVGSPALALETFPEQKRRAVWKIAGDVREHGAELLRRTWEAIGWDTTAEERARYGLFRMGGYQVQYVPALVGPIVELCLSVHEGLRRTAVGVLQSMIVSEWTLSEDLSVIQTEMIDCLDRFFKAKPLTESMLQKLFVTELMQLFDGVWEKGEASDDGLRAALAELVSTMDEFLDLLTAVHTGGSGSGGTGGAGVVAGGTNEAQNIVNRLRLMEFLRDMQKEEIFIRYVHQLATIQAEARNHAEAGLALRLHADLYEWDPLRQTETLADPDFPAQSQFERKERLYFDMIKHFEDGDAWSSALSAYKELREQYESNVFDFGKLARIDRAIATIYEKIARSERVVPRYYRVAFRGLGFPTSLRDKEFVYEGSANERASAFTDRMQEQYPAAQIVTTAAAAADEVEGQFLVVSAVSPHRDLGHHVFQRARVSHAVRDHIVSSHPQAFWITTRRQTFGPARDHHADKTIYTTAEAFPTILRRSEIVSIRDERLSAHETGLERIARKTQEMAALEKRAATDGDAESCVALADAITASVMEAEGSVTCYRDLLPRRRRSVEDDVVIVGLEDEGDEEGEADDTEMESRDVAIRMALVDHAIVLKKALATLGRCAVESARSRRGVLQSYFERTFSKEIAQITPPRPAQTNSLGRPSPSLNPSPTPTHDFSMEMEMADGIVVATAEETSIAQPVALRGRGARLSFLGGGNKRKDTIDDDAVSVNGLPTPALINHHHHPMVHKTTSNDSDRRSVKSKDHGRRRSFFHGRTSHEDNRRSSVDWATESGTATVYDKRRSFDLSGSHHSRSPSQTNGPPNGMAKKGSVRKRLSMLKIGKKGKGGLEVGPDPGRPSLAMGSLDEE